MQLLKVLFLVGAVLGNENGTTTTMVPPPTTVKDEVLDGAESQKLEIVKRIKNVNPDGSYTIGYEADDGSFKIETRDVTGNIKGTYGYLDETGAVRRVTYTTNNGTTPASVVQRILPATRAGKPLKVLLQRASTTTTTKPIIETDIGDVYEGGTVRPLFTTTPRRSFVTTVVPPPSSSVAPSTIQPPAMRYQQYSPPPPPQVVEELDDEMAIVPLGTTTVQYYPEARSTTTRPILVVPTPQYYRKRYHQHPKIDIIDQIQPPVSTKEFQLLLNELIARQKKLEMAAQLMRYHHHHHHHDPQRSQLAAVDNEVVPSKQQENWYYHNQYLPHQKKLYQHHHHRRQMENQVVPETTTETDEDYLPVPVREMLLLRMLQLAMNPSLPVTPLRNKSEQGGTTSQQHYYGGTKTRYYQQNHHRNVEILGEEDEDDDNDEIGQYHYGSTGGGTRSGRSTKTDEDMEYME